MDTKPVKKKNNYSYVGLVGRGQTAAFALINAESLDFVSHKAVFKFPSGRYYEHMLLLATTIVERAIALKLNTVIYTIDSIVDATRAFFKVYRRGMAFDFKHFAEELIRPKRKSLHSDQALLDLERDALAGYLEAVAKTYYAPMTLKPERCKEVDMLNLNIPDGVKIRAGEVLSFTDGKARDGITVFGWRDYNRRTALVKVRYEKHDGEAAPVYFLYRNDNSELGRAKSDMLRHLWSFCPSREETGVNEFCQVA